MYTDFLEFNRKMPKKMMLLLKTLYP